MKISEAIWRAANLILWNGVDLDGEVYSCNAVATAEPGISELFDSRAVRFLNDLGCEPLWLHAFEEFEFGEQRQGARYLWLMFAYLVALDEGL